MGAVVGVRGLLFGRKRGQSVLSSIDVLIPPALVGWGGFLSCVNKQTGTGKCVM